MQTVKSTDWGSKYPKDFESKDSKKSVRKYIPRSNIHVFDYKRYSLDWFFIVFPDVEAANDFLSSYTNKIKFGYIFYQVPVLLCSNIDEATEALADIRTFQRKECLLQRIDEDAPVIFAGVRGEEWIVNMKNGFVKEELQRDLMKYTKFFHVLYDDEYTGMSFATQLIEEEWNIVQLAYFLVKGVIICRPIKYPVFIPFRKRDIPRVESTPIIWDNTPSLWAGISSCGVTPKS